jgi:hypothetical protein
MVPGMFQIYTFIFQALMLKGTCCYICYYSRVPIIQAIIVHEVDYLWSEIVSNI